MGQATWGQVDAAGLQVFQILRRSTVDDKATPLIGPSITAPAATTLTFCPFCNKRRTHQKPEPKESLILGDFRGPDCPAS